MSSYISERSDLFSLRTVVCCALLVLLGAPAALAQPSRDSRGRPDIGAIVRGADRNKNGLLEDEEIQGRLRYYAHSAAKKAGIPTDRPIPVDRLISAMERSRHERDKEHERERSKDNDRERNSSSSNNYSAVPGFGNDTGLAPVPGFDVATEAIRADEGSLGDRYEHWIIERAEKTLREYDKNGNGVLDPEEWKKVDWRGDPRESDLNKDGRLSKTEFCERYVKRWGKGRKSSSGSSASTTSSSSSGRSYGSSPSRSSTSSSSSSGGGSSSSSGESSRYRDYAKKLLKMYDANKNGVLEKNEWIKMKSFYHSADTNRNSVITLDELSARLSQYSKDRGGGSESKSSSSGGSDRRGYSRDRGSSRYSRPSRSSGSSSTSSGNSYRRRLPSERLDGNLPDWFSEKDENKDGQVAMSEYSGSWSSGTLEEFKKYDRNGDAIITPEECQKTIDEEDDD